MKNYLNTISAPCKKLIALLLAVAFVFGAFSALPNIARAESEGAMISTTVYWYYNEANHSLSIRTSGANEFGTLNDGKGFGNGNWPWSNKSWRSEVTAVYFYNPGSTDRKTITTANGYSLAGMFEGFIALEVVDFAGLLDISQANNISKMFKNCKNLRTLNGIENLNTSRIQDMQQMFSGCSSLTSLDLSNWTNNDRVYNMMYFVRGCSALESFILNNANFKTRTVENGSDGCQIGGFFEGCNALRYVDMSNITIGGRLDGSQSLGFGTISGSSSLNGFFQGRTALETVKMNNVKLTGMKNMRSMFKGCTALKTVEMAGLGKLNDIITMDEMFANCASLQTIILDGLDNSAIGPTNNRHSIVSGNEDYLSIEDARLAGAKEFGRDLGLMSCRSLSKLSVKGAKVWMVKNNAGIPGEETFDASSNSRILWWWMGNSWWNGSDHDNGYQLRFEADDGKGTFTLNKRDYVDLVTDRDGGESTPSANGVSVNEYLDFKNGANLNAKHDLNTNGPGFLAPGVYIKLNSMWENNTLAMPYTNYRISYIGEVPYKMLVNGSEVNETSQVGELHIVKNSDHIAVSTVKKPDWPTTGEYSIVLGESGNPTIDIVYENAAGNNAAAGELENRKHVKISIKKITFTNLDRIPTWASVSEAYPGRTDDQNNYIDRLSDGTGRDGSYYRKAFEVHADGLHLTNYLCIDDPTTAGRQTALSGGAGTDIEFEISLIDPETGAKVTDSTFAYYVDDLDVPDHQEYTKNKDACMDNLTPGNTYFGKGGEGFILGAGNNLDTVTFAEHTGLMLVSGDRGSENYVITTGSDPETSWSEFAVVADASGSTYTWTSGVGCTTYALRNTPRNIIIDEYIVYDFSNRIEHKIELPSYAGSAVSGVDYDASAPISLRDYNIIDETVGGETKKYLCVSLDVKAIDKTPVEFNLLAECDINDEGNTQNVQYGLCKLTVLPATNVHYEESYLEYNDDSSKSYAAQWDVEGTAANPVCDVSSGEIIGSGSARQSDANTLYGYDDTYKTQTGDSNGRSMHVRVGQAEFDLVKAKTHVWPTATFSFTGTGVDIVGRTGLNTGVYVVNVKDSRGNTVKSQIINTRYFGETWMGEEYDESNPSSGNGNIGSDLRQVPIVHIDSYKTNGVEQPLPYDTYTVTVQLVWMKGMADLPERGTPDIPGIQFADYELIGFDGKVMRDTYPAFDVYIDAIRIYNPVGKDLNTDNSDEAVKLAAQAYTVAQELNPTYTEIRDIIINGSAADLSAGGTLSGGIAIDLTPHQRPVYEQAEPNTPLLDANADPVYDENEEQVYTQYVQKMKDGKPVYSGNNPVYEPELDENGNPKYEYDMPQGNFEDLAEAYEQYGPNNEMYLKNGQGFAFAINSQYASAGILHISAKVPFGSQMGMKVMSLVNGTDHKTETFSITSATEMYYDCSSVLEGIDEGSEVVLIVTATGTGILSVCHMKTNPADAGINPNLSADYRSLELAAAVIGGRKGDVNADCRIDVVDALLAMRIAIGSTEPNAYGSYCADINCDGNVELMDAIIILRTALA